MRIEIKFKKESLVSFLLHIELNKKVRITEKNSSNNKRKTKSCSVFLGCINRKGYLDIRIPNEGLPAMTFSLSKLAQPSSYNFALLKRL